MTEHERALIDKLTEQDYLDIQKSDAAGTELALQYGVTPTRIYQIKRME